MSRRVCAVARAGSEVTRVLAPPVTPFSCAASQDHIILLDDRGNCFGLGSNDHLKLHEDLPPKVHRFTKLHFPRDFTVREVAVGAKFSAFVTGNGIVIFHGKFYKCENGFKAFGKMHAPRGLSTNLKCAAFCANSSSVFVFTRDSRCKTKVRGENTIKTALTETNLFVLTALGNVYYGRVEGSEVELAKLLVGFPVLTVFASAKRAFVADRNWQLFDAALNVINIPYLSPTQQVGCVNDGVLRLDATGKLTGAADVEVPEFGVACLACFESGFVVFEGKPKPEAVILAPPVDLWPICSSAFHIKGQSVKEQLLAVDSRTAYFKEDESCYGLTADLDKYLTSADVSIKSSKEKDRPVYYTPANRLVFPTAHREEMLEFNFLKGDIVTTGHGVRATFVGAADHQMWLKPTELRCVCAYSDPDNVRDLERPNHSIVMACVDGIPMAMDVTPSFVKHFGRAIGDLMWVPRRGIVQLVGVVANRFVFLDFSDLSLFCPEMYEYRLVRTGWRESQHTRDIVTTRGEVVTLNVCSEGAIFQPGDRVLSEFGDATFLGTDADGNCYVQSDEMRVADIQGARTDLTKLRLMRRIGMKATRRFTLKNGNEVVLSLSALDRVDDLFADDIITTDNVLCRVIGVDTSARAIYAQPMGNGDIFEVRAPATLVYRADILGGKHSRVAEVGSPAYDLSCLVPNDLVRVNGDKCYVFKGIGRSGLLFSDPMTHESFTTSYSPLVMSSAFEVVRRSAFVTRS